MEKINSRRRHNKGRHYNEIIIIGIAVFLFIFVGLTISISIRACTHHNESFNDNINYDESAYNKELVSMEEPNGSSDYTMPDSIVSICMPKPLDAIPEIILIRTSYIVSYNQSTKLPNWVAWNLSSEHTDGPFRRLANFHEDYDIPQPRATLEDYRGSGWSRGHMCPAGDNKWNSKAMFDTFSLTNVCPQNANLNSGLWNSIEIDCRRWARMYGDIYIICGPILFNTEHETIGNNNIIVPEAFFKVILCLNGTPKAIGFIVRNTDGTKKRDLYFNNIDQVERITGLDFFPALPDEIENEVEAEADIREWN